MTSMFVCFLPSGEAAFTGTLTPKLYVHTVFPYVHLFYKNTGLSVKYKYYPYTVLSRTSYTLTCCQRKNSITRKFCHNFNVTAKKFLKNTVTKISLYQSTSCITVFFSCFHVLPPTLRWQSCISLRICKQHNSWPHHITILKLHKRRHPLINMGYGIEFANKYS